MAIVAIFVQVGAKVGVILPAEELAKFGASGGHVHAALRILVPQAFARRAVVGAKPSIGFDGRAVGVERKNVRRDGTGLLVARVAVDAVESRVATERLELP